MCFTVEPAKFSTMLSDNFLPKEKDQVLLGRVNMDLQMVLRPFASHPSQVLLL